MIAQTVANVDELATWSRLALAGAPVTYHVGSLANDRRASLVLNALADTALLLAETNFLRLQQRRMPLSEENEDRWFYLALRSSGGYAPTAIITRSLSSYEWRSLRAIRDRDGRTGATRAVADALTHLMASPMDTARSMVQLLQDRALIVPAPGKGWELSPAGVEALT